MSKVIASMSMSLDGYVADLNHGVSEVFDWYFTFVTDCIESAVNQAKAAAAGKSVGVHGADIIQQCLNAGLLDEISVDIAAVLVGSGVRLFGHLVGTPAILGNPTVIPGVRRPSASPGTSAAWKLQRPAVWSGKSSPQSSSSMVSNSWPRMATRSSSSKKRFRSSWSAKIKLGSIIFGRTCPRFRNPSN